MLNEFLISVSGANRAVLEKAPGDRVKQSTLGGVLLTTAGLAVVSCTFALVLALHAPLIVALAFALGWGIAILNLDRWLVVATTRQPTPWQNIKMALPRLIFAVIIGLVVSTPLTLQIFKSEINTELTVMQADEKALFEQRLSTDPRFKDLDAERAQIATLVGSLGGAAVGQTVLNDPELKDLRARLDAVQQQYAAAQAAVICEDEGTCGSGVAGAGIAYNAKVATRDGLRTQRDALQKQFDDTQATVRAAATAAATTRAATNQQRLDELRSRVAASQEARDAESARHATATVNGDGLLARLSALHKLGQADGTFLLAHLALFLLFTILECLPVLFKVILLLGKPSLYEQLTLLGEEAVLAQQRLHLESAQRELTIEVAAANEPHETRLRNQLDTELAAAKAVLDAQADLASKAVGMWKRNQENLLETDLDAFVTTAAQTANAGAAPPGRSSTYADASSFFAPPTQNRGSAYRAGDGGNASPREDRGWRSATTVLPPEQVRWGGADQPPAAWPARIFSRLGWRSRSAGRR